jgi:hypothetical protein
MRIKITKPDGTTIEAEGTAEECERIAAPSTPVVSPTPFDSGPVFVPVVVTAPAVEEPWWRTQPTSTFRDLPAGVIRTNGGVRCDMEIGPCACGAWHQAGEPS